MEEQIVEGVIDTIAHTFALEKESIKTSDKVRGGYTIDSLDELDLVMSLESKFDVSLTEEMAERLTTVQDYIDVVRRLVEERNSDARRDSQ